MKTKSIQTIESKMENMDADSMRYEVLENAKSFKTSWPTPNASSPSSKRRRDV